MARQARVAVVATWKATSQAASHAAAAAASLGSSATRAAASSTQAVVAHVQCPAPCADSNAWLATQARGAYTGARTLGRTRVVAWRSHLARTAASLRGLRADLHLSDGGLCIGAAATSPPWAIGVHAAARCQTGEAANLHAHVHGEDLVLDAMSNPAILDSWMRILCATALRQYYEVNCLPVLSSENHAAYRNGTHAIEETKITWLAGLDGTVAVHCAPMTPPGPSADSGLTLVKVAVGVGPRAHAANKDTAWVSSRSALVEAYMATGDTNEVVLADSTCMYEGLSSNFFAVLPDCDRVAPDGGKGQPAAETRPPGFVVVTAPPGEHVLAGTIQQIVSKVLAEDAASAPAPVRLVQEAPTLALANRWVAAFITSTSRLVCPLARVEFVPEGDARDSVSQMPGSLALDHLHPITAWIAEKVRQHCERDAEMVLSDADTHKGAVRSGCGD